MFATLALASAACYGAADFLGGLASRRAQTLAIVVVSQLAGLVLLGLMLPFVPEATPVASDYLWGVASGVTGGAGVALLYHALAVGAMAIVAPITAVCAVTIPVLAAVALGERPERLALVGIVLAVVAIGLVSRSRDQGSAERPGRSLSLAFLSGIAIGLFFLCLARTSSDSGLWPLIMARLTSVPFFGVVAVAAGRSLRMPMRVGVTAVLGGGLDMLANLLYLIATHSGPLSLVVTLASLYPASTVLLARFTLGERLTSAQTLGVVCAMAAILLIVGSQP